MAASTAARFAERVAKGRHAADRYAALIIKELENAIETGNGNKAMARLKLPPEAVISLSKRTELRWYQDMGYTKTVQRGPNEIVGEHEGKCYSVRFVIQDEYGVLSIEAMD